MRKPSPRSANALLAIGVVFLAAGCGRTVDEGKYRGRAFDMGKPTRPGWVLVSKPKSFTLRTTSAGSGFPEVASSKVVELVNRERRTSIEVFLVADAADSADKVMDAILRKWARRGLVEGEHKPITVSGRKGAASIAIWHQTREAPEYYLYCVRVPLGDALWCFVGSADKAGFETARSDFEYALKTVTFH